MIEQFDLLQEEAELIGAMREIHEEIKWFNNKLGKHYFRNRDALTEIESRRGVLEYKLEEKIKRIKEIQATHTTRKVTK